MVTKREAVIIGTVLVIAVVVTALWVYQYKIRSKGRIKSVGVEIFGDSDCTKPITEIDWGILSPGDVVNCTLYIKNTGNTDVNLTMFTNEWNPETSENYLSLTWSYANETLTTGQVFPVDLTLTVSADVTGINQFDFLITITAEG